MAKAAQKDSQRSDSSVERTQITVLQFAPNRNESQKHNVGWVTHAWIAYFLASLRNIWCMAPPDTIVALASQHKKGGLGVVSHGVPTRSTNLIRQLIESITCTLSPFSLQGVLPK